MKARMSGNRCAHGPDRGQTLIGKGKIVKTKKLKRQLRERNASRPVESDVLSSPLSDFMPPEFKAEAKLDG